MIINCSFVSPNTNFVQTEWIIHMQVCLEDMCNFPRFTILSIIVYHFCELYS